MRKLKLFFACLLMAVLSIGQVWAAEQLAYTLAPATGSNNSYAGNCDVTISGITWNVTGNASLTPWRLGGKSLSGVDRAVYSKTAMTDAITKVELTVGAASSINVNSLKLVVASNSDFSTVIDEVTETFAANSTITFTPTSPATDWATGAYYKFIFNVSVSGTSNKFVAFTEAKFYKEVATATCETPTFSPAAGTFFGEQEITLATSTAGASIYYTTDGTTPSSSNGTLYDDPFSIDETTTIKAIAVKAGASDSEVAEATYTAGTPVSTFDIDFEKNNLTAYINWNFVNIASTTSTITAYAGTYYGKTSGTASASITTKEKYANPGLLTFYTSKESGNTTASSWIVQVSEDGEDWTTAIATFDATTGDKGTWTAREADLSGHTNVYVRIAYSGSTAVRAIDNISLATASEIAKPAISGDESFLTSTEVEITCSTGGVTIYYTNDGTDPKTSDTKQTYSDPFSINETTTIRAIANLGAAWSAEATSKTFTKITPITVAAAIAAIPNKDDVVNDQYVSGIVCTAGASVSSGKMTYYISDDGSETNRLQIYKGKNVGNTNFNAATDLAIGDRVVVFGQLKNYNNTPEMNDGNYLVSKADPAVAAPVFTPNGGGFMGETDVTITCATAGSAIYYTLDGTTPSKSSTPYTAAIHLDATTTITAVAYVGDDASLVIAKTFTLTAPMTVAEALAALESENPINNVAVAGIISTAPSSNPSSGKLTYFISDDGFDSDELEVYKGFGVAGASFSDKTDLQVGDVVTVFGNLTIYNTTKEFAEGSRLIAFNRPQVAVTGINLTESTAEVEEGKTVTLHASVVPGNATDQGIVWSVTSGSDKASVDENGVVTGTAAGEAVIRAASHEDASIYEECTVTVTAVDPTVHHVTFIAGTDQSDETSITKDGITISATTFNNDSYYQCYASSAMTVSSTVGNITNIELTCTASGTAKYGPGNWDFTGYSYGGANGSWTGSAETVEFGNASQQVRMTLITVTYKEDNREAAGLAWNPVDDIEITVGGAFSAPTLHNPNSIDAAEITIASDNTDLATVSAGVVSLVADATGTATITATFAGNDDYKPATISYNITVNEAGLDNVTFDSSEDHAESGETTITKGGFTLSFTSGSMDGTQAEYRLYKGQTMTLSSTDYKIKKIEFTCTSGNPIAGFADATGLDKDNNEWTGESNTVELTASNAQVRMTKIKVFYVEDTRAAAGLAWDPADDIEITVGGAFSAPTLHNPNSIDAAEITIASSNEAVATINNSGEVALVADATGTTTITATFTGNDDFKPATVSYKIKVNPAYAIYVSPSLNVNFGSVDKDAVVADKTITVTLTGVAAATLTLAGAGASAFTISPAAAMTESGDITISASSANLGTFAATLTISDDDNNAGSKVVNLSLTVTEPVIAETPVATDSKWVPATEITDGMQVLIVGVNNTDYSAMGVQNNNNRAAVAASVDGEGVLTPGANTMAFTVVDQLDGTYALRTSNEKYLYAAASGSNYLKTQDEVDVNAKWTLSLTSAVAESSSNRNVMQFNSGSSIFSCYGTASQKPIALYVPKPATPEPTSEDVRTGLELNRYYTICLGKNVTAATGAMFWNLKNRNEAETEVYLEEVTLPLEAGKPYIFQASAETLNVTYGDEEANSPVENGALRGTFENLDAAALAAKADKVYILINNSIRPAGSENSLSANRAYINYDALTVGTPAPAPGRRVRAIPMQPQVATGIEDVQGDNVQSTKVLINGQLFILRGEKMYDATGRLVK